MTNNTVDNPAAFTSSAAFEIRLPARGGVRKSATLRMPTVAEWAARQRAIKSVQHRLGPGMQESKTEGVEAADFALLKRLMLDDNGEFLDGRGPAGHRDEFDEDEASELIQRLGRADIDEEPGQDGDALTVSVTVVGGVVTKHTLRMPTLKELRAHRKGSFSFIDLRRGRQQVRLNVEEFCRFYDQLSKGVEGYEGEVAPMHRMAAVSELLAVIDELEAEDDPKR